MPHELIERAREQRRREEQREQATRARRARFDEALEELDRREHLLSFPDHHWNGDSHLQVREDRDLLIALMDQDDGEPDMADVAGPARSAGAKSTEQLLQEIRDNLNASN